MDVATFASIGPASNDCHACFGVARKDGPMHRRGATPPRQQRRMHVDHAQARDGQNVGGQDAPVRGNDAKVCLKARQLISKFSFAKPRGL
jgi:hypothetical protein